MILRCNAASSRNIDFIYTFRSPAARHFLHGEQFFSPQESREASKRWSGKNGEASEKRAIRHNDAPRCAFPITLGGAKVRACT